MPFYDHECLEGNEHVRGGTNRLFSGRFLWPIPHIGVVGARKNCSCCIYLPLEPIQCAEPAVGRPHDLLLPTRALTARTQTGSMHFSRRSFGNIWPLSIHPSAAAAAVAVLWLCCGCAVGALF